MSWHFGIVRLTDDEDNAVRAFAAERGLWRDGPLGEAFWAEASDPAAVTPRGMGGSYESAGDLPAALDRTVARWLGVREWRAAGNANPLRVLVPPFGFEPGGVAPRPTRAGEELMLADPRRLVWEWPGADDPDYDARSRAAWRALLTGSEAALDAPDAEGRARLDLGVHRWLHEMAKAAWHARVFWAVRW
ncbi:MAG: hypothetical protein AB8I08_40880 [Sandaracinaceae bacterium]